MTEKSAIATPTPTPKKRRKPKSKGWGGNRQNAGRPSTLPDREVKNHRYTLLCNEALRARIEAIRLNKQESNSSLLERLILPELERLELQH